MNQQENLNAIREFVWQTVENEGITKESLEAQKRFSNNVKTPHLITRSEKK